MTFAYAPRRGCSLRTIATIGVACLLAACSTLPSSGPTGPEIRSAARKTRAQLPFKLIEVDTFGQVPAPPQLPSSSLAPLAEVPADTIGPGDVLNITIYEAGVALFGGSSRSIGAPLFDPSANAERLPPVRVDDFGFIRLPFTGTIRAAGATTAQLQSTIRSRLQGLSQDPQVLVSVAEPVTNTVILSGEISRPGRLALATNRETLSDAIALAGGYRGDAKDIVARVQRQGQIYEVRLADLLDLPILDLPIGPGDKITLVNRPQSFSVLGAPNRSDEIRFPRTTVSLSQAVALAGGVNPNLGDAGAIFVFRYKRLPNGTEEPVIYHVNMMKADAYFIAQRFMIRDRDLIYVGNAQANQPTKFVQLLSQLFVPVTTVRATIAQ